jgi:hypothetical protein
VNVAVAVPVGTPVSVGVAVGVSSGSSVSVAVDEEVGTAVPVGVSSGSAVKVGVALLVRVAVRVGVVVGVKVSVGDGVAVRVRVAVGVGGNNSHGNCERKVKRCQFRRTTSQVGDEARSHLRMLQKTSQSAKAPPERSLHVSSGRGWISGKRTGRSRRGTRLCRLADEAEAEKLTASAASSSEIPIRCNPPMIGSFPASRSRIEKDQRQADLQATRKDRF